MLTINLSIKPLSTNSAWQGRRFSTRAKKDFEARVGMMMPKMFVVGKPYYRVAYDFHLRSFAMTDWDNCCKTLQDCLVKRGILTDDRLIVDVRVRKFPSQKDRIVVRIEGCALHPDDLELPR